MFSAERIRKIKELLLEYKEVDINTLCSCFSASVSTIRRDLGKLEEDGFLRRIHGGAVLVEADLPRDDLGITPSTHTEESYQIAKLAVKMIGQNDVIFLGGGCACTIIASLLQNNFRGTIYTNNLEAAWILRTCADISIILLGGKLHNLGGQAITDTNSDICFTSNIFVDKAFFTVSGFTKRHGYFVDDTFYRQLIDTLVTNSIETNLILEGCKLDRIGTVRVDAVDRFPRVISSAEIADEYKQFFYDNQVTLFTPFSEF